MTKKPYLYYIICPAPFIEAIRDLAVQLGDGGEAERLNFSIPIATQADPSTVVAYGGGTGPVGQHTVDVLDSMIAAGLIPPQVLWVRCRNEKAPPRILKTNHAPTQARIDAGEEPMFDMQTALQDAGMVLWEDPERVRP